MSEYIDSYRKTLKPRETEEFPNAWIFRPAAFVIVWIIRKTKITPNHITIISFIFGVTAGVMLALCNHVLAFIALLLMVIFDCADGQLARLTGRSSKIGKILDVTADILSYFSFFTGVAVYRYTLTGNFNEFYFIPLSFLAITLNIIFYDQFKNQYIRYVYTDYHEKLEALEHLKEEYRNEKNPFFWLARVIYFAFYLAETKVIYLGSLLALKKHKRVYDINNEIDKETSAQYKKHFFFMTRLWSLLGTGTHYFLMLVCLSLGYCEFLLYIFIIYSYIALGVLVVIQNIVFLFYKSFTK